MDATNYSQQRTRAWIYAGFGITGFSLTLPMTRLAIGVADPVAVGLGRALVAAVLALIALLITRQTIPSPRYWWRFALVGGGVVIGFPLLSSLAMTRVSATHGAVFTGLIPLATALATVLRGGERPSSTYWASSVACCVLVFAFAYSIGAGRLQWADLALFCAVIAAGIGYAEGALLARIFGHWQVICWALLLSVPVIVAVIAYRGVIFSANAFTAQALSGWYAFIYISIISMFGAFMLWYRGLAIGGVAQVGQLQFVQPFMTMIAATLWFGETLPPSAVIFALGILLLIFLGRYSVGCTRELIVDCE